MMYKINQVVTSNEVYRLIKEIHYDSIGFEEGDIVARIFKHDKYIVKLISLNEIGDSLFLCNQDLVEEYSNMDINTMPPVLLDNIDFNTYFVEDGTHRVKVAKLKNMDKILSFVPLEK